MTIIICTLYTYAFELVSLRGKNDSSALISTRVKRLYKGLQPNRYHIIILCIIDRNRYRCAITIEIHHRITQTLLTIIIIN